MTADLNPAKTPSLAPAGSPSTPALQAARPAGMGRHLALLSVVVFLIVLDLWSKSAVFSWLGAPGAGAEVGYSERGHVRYSILGDWLGFMLNLNYGAAFGNAAGFPWLLISGRCVACVFLAWLIFKAPRGQRVYLAGLVFILAGALGNLHDNFFNVPNPGWPGVIADRPFGPVRDFVDVYFFGWDWHFPTFNVADSCVTVGAALLLLSGFFAPKEPAPAS